MTIEDKHVTEINPVVEDVKSIDKMSLIEKYLNYIDVSDATTRTYYKALKNFFLYLKENNINKPCRDDIMNYKKYLSENGKKASTIQVYITSVKLYFRWLSLENIYDNIADHIKTPRIDRGFKKSNLTVSECEKLIENVNSRVASGDTDRKEEGALRDRAMISLALTSGLRTIEIRRADIGDINVIGNDKVLFIQGKGHDDKDNYIKIPDIVDEYINDYLSYRESIAKNSNDRYNMISGKSPLFSSVSNNSYGGRLTTRGIRNVIKEYLKEIGLANGRYSAHSLRHTAATLNLLNGGTLEETQQLLRHKKIDTTMIYLHHLDRMKNQSEKRIADTIFKNVE